MTKKETTTPVVKEEKAKAKRSRKPKTVKEVVENPQQVEIPASPAPISEQDLKIAELQAQFDLAQKNNMDLLAQIEDKTKAYDNLRTTYNKLLEDYKVEKNKNKQISKALEEAKARATEYKSSWNAAKAARDQFASETAKAKSALVHVEKELDDTRLDRDAYVTSWNKARMLAAIFGIAFVATFIVAIVVAFA